MRPIPVTPVLARCVVPALLASMVATAALDAQQAQQAQPAPGAIAGVVHEAGGTLIEDAEVQLVRSPRVARTDANGRFVLDSIAPGLHEIVVRKVGFTPARAEVRVRADSATMLSIALVAEAQALGEVRITGRRQNLLHGLVVDSLDRPIPGVSVVVLGLDREATTDATGRFRFPELPPGDYLLQARKLGFSLAQHNVRMADRLERDITLRLRVGAYPLTALEIGVARIAAREAMSRLAMRERANTSVLNREYLARFGREGLDFALERSAARQVRLETPFKDYCVLVDGWRALGRNPLSADAGAGGSMLGSTRSASLNPGGAVVQSFFADQVEMVEVYPEETESSTTLCSRFKEGSGCECPPFKRNPPTLVVWLRK